MSTETHVLFTGPLPGKDELDRAMEKLGFPFAIKPLPFPLDRQRGFMPMLFRGKDTGVEFDMFEGRDAVEDIAQGADVARPSTAARAFAGAGISPRRSPACAPRPRSPSS